MTKFKQVSVGRFPENLDDGCLYVSQTFEMTLHKCACGCGHKVFTFLGDGHTLSGTPEKPTLRPSIGVWDAPCRSHYLMTEGDILWCKSFTPEQISAAMQFQLTRHIQESQPVKPAPEKNWLARILQAAKNWFR